MGEIWKFSSYVIIIPFLSQFLPPCNLFLTLNNHNKLLNFTHDVPSMKTKLFKQIKRFLPIFGIILFFYLIYILDVDKIYTAFLSIPPLYIILSALISIPVILLRNYIWILVSRQQHIHMGYRSSMKIFLIGYFYGTITPGYIGQLMRIPYMKEKTREPYGKLFVNTFLETTLHALSLYIMMMIGGILIISIYPRLVIIICIWLLVMTILFIFFLKKERGEPLLSTLIKYMIPKRSKKNVQQFVNTFYADFPKARMLLIPLLLGSITWVLMFIQYYLIILALGISTIPFLMFLVLYPIANTASFIPITFAGLGTREFTAIILFTSLFAVSQTQVFVFTLVGFLITDVLTGFYGFILLLTEAKQKDFIKTDVTH